MAAGIAGMDADRDILYVSGLVAAIFKCPTWVSPIANFVDGNCAVFEDKEENRLEYTLIHNAFKGLVDELLDAHLGALNITQEQFTRFCQHGFSGSNEFHKELVEQLLSVDDFMFFKAMMVKRNAQLTKQAMELYGLALMSGGLPLEPDYSEHFEAQRKLEEDYAALEAEKQDLQRKCIEAELQLAMALSMQLQKRLQLMETLSEILEAIADMRGGPDNGTLEAAAAAAEMADMEFLIQPVFVVTESGPASLDDEHAAALQRERAQRAMEASRQTAAVCTAKAAQGPTEEERRARAEHLKRQRDALLVRKQQERESQLQQHKAVVGMTPAAETAERAMARQEEHRGKRLAAELGGQVPNPVPALSGNQDSERGAEMRRALAAQLRATFR